MVDVGAGFFTFTFGCKVNLVSCGMLRHRHGTNSHFFFVFLGLMVRREYSVLEHSNLTELLS